METVFKHISKYTKWYLFALTILWLILIWTFPVQFSYNSNYEISNGYLFAIFLPDAVPLFAMIFAIFSIVCILFLIVNCFLSYKYKRLIIVALCIMMFILSFVMAMQIFTIGNEILYPFIQLFIALIYILILYSDKLLIKLQSHKQSPPNTKQKLETQEQQIADLQKQIAELKANHKTEE